MLDHRPDDKIALDMGRRDPKLRRAGNTIWLNQENLDR